MYFILYIHCAHIFFIQTNKKIDVFTDDGSGTCISSLTHCDTDADANADADVMMNTLH